MPYEYGSQNYDLCLVTCAIARFERVGLLHKQTELLFK